MIYSKEQNEMLKELVNRIRLEKVSEKIENELVTQRVYKIHDEPLILLIYQFTDETHDWFIVRPGEE